MLNVEELQKFKKSKRYKKSNRIFFSLKNILYCWKKVSLNGDAKLAVYKAHNNTSVTTVLKVIMYLLKPLFISYEIIDIKKKIIDRVLNGTIHNYEISALIKKKTYYWMEYKVEKIEVIRDVVFECLEDSGLEQSVLMCCEHLQYKEKEDKYNLVIENLRCKFDEIITECKQETYAIGVIGLYGYKKTADIILKSSENGMLTTKETGEGA